MIYGSVSIESVISKVIRETKILDSSAVMELYEVIPDAMGMLQTRFQLHHTWKDLDIRFHKARLPAGLLVLPAVEYCGHRLRWSNSSRAVDAPTMWENRMRAQEGHDTIYQSSVNPDAVNPITQDKNSFFSTNIRELHNLPEHSGAFYFVEMGYLNTSFADGKVRIHYKEAPKDKNGNLLIPDNSNYRESLYYWCRAKLIGMGAFVDNIIGEEKCMYRFEKFGSMAVDEIDYPTEDQMQSIVANQVRLVPPAGYWENFGAAEGRMIYG